MSEPSNQLCDGCHEREAIYHSLTISDGVEVPSHLCGECFEASAVTVGHEISLSLKAARCEFCDAPAFAGGVDTFGAVLGIQRTYYRCLSCLEEYDRYTAEMLDDVQTGLSGEEERAAIGELSENADRHMQQFVKEMERGNQ